MSDEKIEVQWIGTANQMVGVLDRLEAKFDKQEAQLQRLANTSTKTATAAAGSFNKLESELKESEAALRGLTMGTAEFTAQKNKVDALRDALAGAKSQLASNVGVQSGASALVNQFTSAISGTVGTILSVGAIVQSLKADLENIARNRENARLAEVDFGTALAARTISNLPDAERTMARPLAMTVAEDIGANPGAVVEALGELRSTGANSLTEAAAFLKEAADAFPQDLAAARGIAKAALIEATATGNRDPRQVIGGTITAQAVSLTKSPEEFAKAFGSNIASAVSVYQQTPERAREEAAIFSLLETRGAEVAADAQRSFYTQISKFVPKMETELKTGEQSTLPNETVQRFMQAGFQDRQAMLESDAGLRRQFFDNLQETGRTAIIRRLQPTAEDRQVITTAQTGIAGDQQAAQMLAVQQERAGVAAAFAVAEGRRQAQKTTAELRESELEKITAELEQTYSMVDERLNAGFGGSVTSMASRGGMLVEQFMSGQDRGTVLENTLRFNADNETNPERRAFLEQQVGRIDSLKAQAALLQASNMEGLNRLIELQEENNRLLREQRGNRPATPATRPKEAALPAATVP